mgnify:CR=1 FL=1
MEMISTSQHREPWNKGKLVGQKAPFKLKEIWAIRTRLQMAGRSRDLALFDLGIDSKLRGCDLVKLRVRDVCHGDQIAPRAIVMQQKTQRPVQFEITPSTREAVVAWIKQATLKSEDYLFPSRIHNSPHMGTRQYARVLGGWVHACHRPRCISLWDAFHAAHQGLADLSADEEPEGGAAITWAHQARKHRALPRHRG